GRGEARARSGAGPGPAAGGSAPGTAEGARASARARAARTLIGRGRAGPSAARRAWRRRLLVGGRVRGLEPVEALGARLGPRAARGDSALSVPAQRAAPIQRRPGRRPPGRG